MELAVSFAVRQSATADSGHRDIVSTRKRTRRQPRVHTQRRRRDGPGGKLASMRCDSRGGQLKWSACLSGRPSPSSLRSASSASSGWCAFAGPARADSGCSSSRCSRVPLPFLVAAAVFAWTPSRALGTRNVGTYALCVATLAVPSVGRGRDPARHQRTPRAARAAGWSSMRMSSPWRWPGLRCISGRTIFLACACGTS